MKVKFIFLCFTLLGCQPNHIHDKDMKVEWMLHQAEEANEPDFHIMLIGEGIGFCLVSISKQCLDSKTDINVSGPGSSRADMDCTLNEVDNYVLDDFPETFLRISHTENPNEIGIKAQLIDPYSGYLLPFSKTLEIK